MPRQIAFQGEPGAFSEEAIASIWPNESVLVPLATFEAVVRAVAERRVDAGVLPVENSIAGPITESITALAACSAVHVIGESTLRITQCLMAPHGAHIETLASVESHPVALAQCRRFLRRYHRIITVPVTDTAGAARTVAAANDSRRGAIAGRNAARLYGLAVLAEGIEDDPKNSTRFVIVAPSMLDSRLLPGRWHRLQAVRGATTVDVDEPDAICEATTELLRALVDRNGITSNHLVSALFSVTNDLTSDFPARAARELGWTDTPLMCMSEIPVLGALGRCVRVMLHVEFEHPRAPLVPIYLRGAEILRQDVAFALAPAAGID